MDKKSVFDEYLDIKTVFRNREVLRPTYTPEDLPHRGNQINHLASILVAALKNETPSNVFIYGKTGTGKTAVVRLIGKELEKKAMEITKTHQKEILKITLEQSENGINEIMENITSKVGFQETFGLDLDYELKKTVNYIYINCQHVDTQYRILTHIANTMISRWDDRLPLTGLPTDEVYNRLLNSIDKYSGVTIIILDEIDKLVEKSGDDILYNLTRINSDLKNSKASIIGITNNLKFTDFLDARVKSSLGEDELIFPPYDAEQLQDILNQRAGNAFIDRSLESSVIPLCAALAAQEHGDARRALDLLRVSAELAEREGGGKVIEKHVRKALNKIEQDTVAEVIDTLPPQSKLVLLGIILNEEMGTDKLTTGMVFDTYKELCKQINLDVLTQRRITDLISELDMLGIINARLVSFGRGGRTRLIQLSVPIGNTKKVLERSELLKDIIDFKPPMQSTLI
ncbi:MAG: Cdc6/Cdc18 family protein [Candidatus Thorarchaeota archaeon]